MLGILKPQIICNLADRLLRTQQHLLRHIYHFSLNVFLRTSAGLLQIAKQQAIPELCGNE